MPEQSEIKNAKILIVDDIPANIDVLRKFLALEGYRLAFATSGDKALKIVERSKPDLILLDIMMPGMDGYEVCQILKSQADTKDIPVIFLTAMSETKDKIKGFELGAVDYITKPLEYAEVIARVTTHIKLQMRTSELKRRTLETEEALREAELANRAKTTFLATMSHELRTPLNAILGYTDLIQDDATDLGYQDIIPDLTKIHTAAQQLLHVISEVLDYAKIEAEKIKLDRVKFELSELFEDLVGRAGPLISAGSNQFQVRCQESIGTLETDRAKLEQILWNILTNAAKFTSHGRVEFEIQRTPESIVFKISDTGIGIERDKLDRIFRPFAQADDSTTRPYDGAGIGLAICAAYCRFMGGMIIVNSEPGQGSVFTVELPCG